ncbi:MAG: hypothetical protein IKA63_02725 [Clostridia bacterium]|nr:hypothetical protein [Clostridia bacterium]
MANIFGLGIADLSVEMHSRSPFVEHFCHDYLIDLPSHGVDMIAVTTEEQVDEELRAVEGTSRENAESLCLYRAIAEQLPRFDAAVFHGAAISYGDRAFLFTAPSGTGKSTHIKLWRKYLGDAVDIVNGDKPVLRLTETGVNVCSTPWAGKERWHKNRIVPLGALCLLKRGTVNRIRRADPTEHVEELLNQIYLPKNAEALGTTLELLDQLCRRVPLFVLECDISEEAVRTAFTAMTQEPYPNQTEGN